MTISSLARRSLIILLFLLPSWGVISAQLGHFLGSSVFAASKYAIIFFVFFFGFARLSMSKAKLAVGFPFLFICSYLIYVFLHFIGDTEPYLVFEGMRHEVLFLALAVLLLANSLLIDSEDIFPSFNVIVASIVVNSTIAIFFAVWQYFDVSILEFLYRKNLDDISNIKLAIGYRLTSTMVNPINFASFLVIFFIFVNYLHERKSLSSIYYYPIVLLVFLLVAGSLSRLALLSFLVVFVYLYFSEVQLSRLLVVLFLAMMLFLYLISFYDLSIIFSRFNRLFELDTYTENERLKNWLGAIFILEFHQYFWGRGIGASSPDSSLASFTSALVVENGFLSSFIQYGLIGFIFLLILIGRFFYIAFFIGRFDVKLGKLVIGFLLFFFFITLGNDFFRNSPFSFLFWFFYAYFESTYRGYRAGRLS